MHVHSFGQSIHFAGSKESRETSVHQGQHACKLAQLGSNKTVPRLDNGKRKPWTLEPALGSGLFASPVT
eukprot:845169-Pelagomonas_calceolata.AAC.1